MTLIFKGVFRRNIEDIEEYECDYKKSLNDGDMIRGSVMAGQVCGQLQAIRPVAEILSELDKDAKQTLKDAGNIAI